MTIGLVFLANLFKVDYNYGSVNSPFCYRGWNLLSNLQEKGGIYRILIFTGVLLEKKGMTLFRELHFLYEKKLKSEIFNYKKSFCTKNIFNVFKIMLPLVDTIFNKS